MMIALIFALAALGGSSGDTAAALIAPIAKIPVAVQVVPEISRIPIGLLCQRSLTGSGVATSPGYPNNYGNNAYCTWTLRAATGSFVLLTFTGFDLESNFDFLTIYSDGIFIARYTGSQLPPSLTLGRNATLIFTSDSSVVKKGFSVTFSSIAANCGGLVAGSGVIRSPGNPGNYGNNLVCVWGVVPTQGKTITLQFQSFSVENNFDKLEVYYGSALVARYTGTAIPPLLNLGAAARLVFRTDASVVSTGFSINFLSAALTCGGVILGSGVITSPNYPAVYPANASCTWSIFAPSAYNVRLQFTAFTTEKYFDTVRVYQGQTLQATYSGNNITALASYNVQPITVVFTSDRSIQATGFRLLVSASYLT